MGGKAEGVSINRFACGALAGAVRWRAGGGAGDEGAAGADGGDAPARDKDEHVWEFWREFFRDR
jgi:hypothetical protein